jgi:hypothetical protein
LHICFIFSTERQGGVHCALQAQVKQFQVDWYVFPLGYQTLVYNSNDSKLRLKVLNEVIRATNSQLTIMKTKTKCICNIKIQIKIKQSEA